ncbi:MAG: PAS domain-containing protein [Acidobacteria bacterium]|nr:PAS domain-containing protein [Acidobacteriota bacterium]
MTPRRSTKPTLSPRDPTTLEAVGLGDVFFRQMVANMRNGVLAIKRDGLLVLINGEACRIFGLPVSTTYVGRPYSEVLRHHPDIVRVLAGAFELAALPNRADLRLKPTDKVIGYTLSLVRDDDGEATGAALFFKDLTHVEQLEERERLRDRLAAVGEMAATVAHEIKNPLAGIEVMAGLLKRQLAGNRDALGLVSEIINEAKMANAIVQEVLEFVRPVRLQMERTPLLHALQNAVAVADGKVRRGQIAITLDVPAEIPPIKGDGHQLTQVFGNLLINAYEALEGGGTIAIAARLTHDGDDGALLPDGHEAVPTVIVEVADDGPGVASELTDKIFNPFFTTKPQGSGLGLAIVRKIVDAHEGRIDMTSVPGRGTCFRVSLPVESTSEWVR